ncbi:MAG: sulfatase-like hydrolase/transferase [Bacteroidales bacterium]|nr:sulfatase-like hydrolase/transferase [Bacteroidales bacterium]
MLQCGKQEHRNEPFFIAAGFYKPHCPWITPSKYFDIYNIEQIKLPEISHEIRKVYPPLSLASTDPWPWFGLTLSQASECKLAYYAAISFVDAQIGRVLDALDYLGLSENTIVIFWSDHGYHLGEHGLWFKQSCFEESAKNPLIISVPGMKNRGKICRKIVELVDIYPTLAELTGLKVPDGIEGYSIVRLLENPEAKWNKPAFTQVQRGTIPGHSVRTEKWIYTEWGFGERGAELYYEINDPMELKNLAGDNRYTDVVKEMKSLLKSVHPVPVQGGKALPDTKQKFCN